jgi:hypothetical protein
MYQEKKYFTVQCDSERALVFIQDIETKNVWFLNMNNISTIHASEDQIIVDGVVILSMNDNIAKFQQLKTMITYHIQYLIAAEKRMDALISNFKG